MDQKNEQKAPLRIKNLAELKRCIRPGTELVATSHSKHPTLVGLVRVVTEVQTNAYYSVVKDQPTHQYSTCNYGKGFRSDFEKASNYLFEGTTIKVLDRRSGDNSVLYEMELYPGECLMPGQKSDTEENEGIREDDCEIKQKGMGMTLGHKQTGNCFDLTKQVADGLVNMQELSKGLFLVQSEMAFKKETELREEYPERKVFQLSFCMNGICEWNYRESGSECYQLSPTQCGLQCGTFSQCVSHFSAEKPYRTLSISLEQERFSPLMEDLEAMHLVRQDNKICTHVFSTSPGIRFVLQQLLDCPPERKLRKLYLEGKVLELVSLFCDEVVGTQKNDKGISREDYRCLMKAREIIDNHFLHPLTIAQIAEQCFLSETKLKQGFKICFNCTVYEYIVEKRMEMAYRLLQSGKYKVKDVVWMVGYSNTSHFIAVFRKRYGVTPGEI